jgi:hypothetical protein
MQFWSIVVLLEVARWETSLKKYNVANEMLESGEHIAPQKIDLLHEHLQNHADHTSRSE